MGNSIANYALGYERSEATVLRKLMSRKLKLGKLMLRKSILISLLIMLLLLFMLPGCSNIIGSQALKGQINVMQQQLMAEDWEALGIQMNRLNKIYSDNEWKLQLIGDEGEYERLHESINRLQAAITAKDIQAASLELATIESIAEDIYSL